MSDKSEKVGVRVVVQPQDLAILEELKNLSHCGSLSTAASLIISRYGRQMIEWWKATANDSLQGEIDIPFTLSTVAASAPKIESARTICNPLEF